MHSSNNRRRNSKLQSFSQIAVGLLPFSNNALPVNSIVMQKIVQLVNSGYQKQQQQQQQKNYQNHYNDYRQKKRWLWRTTQNKLELVQTYFPYVIYGLCICRLLMYAYYIEAVYSTKLPFIKYDFFISAGQQAEIQLDRILLLSLIGAPLFASTVQYLIESGNGNKSPNSRGCSFSMAVHLYDVVNRNAAQMEEAVGRYYFSFSYQEIVTTPQAFVFRLLRTLWQLNSGQVPLVRSLKPLYFYPNLSPIARQHVLFWAVGAEIGIRAMYSLAGKLK